MIALHRPLRLWPLVVALAAVGAQAVGAQVGTTTDIITGTVTGPDSQPLAGGVVVATSLETRVSRQRTTDLHGRFTIVFPDGGGRYELTARFIGMAPAQVSVARQADEDRIEASIRMGLFAVPLEPITVSARSSARDRKSTRLNSSHGYISYAVFCLKKKKKEHRSNMRNSNNIHKKINQRYVVTDKNISWPVHLRKSDFSVNE